MIRIISLGAALAGVLLGSTAFAQETVKVGIFEGLSGPPAITDFGDSYLQGIKAALRDYEAAGGKTKIEPVLRRSTNTRLHRSGRPAL